jgi:hypothetical protein
MAASVKTIAPSPGMIPKSVLKQTGDIDAGLTGQAERKARIVVLSTTLDFPKPECE